MSEFMERVQEVALRRWPVGNQPTFGPDDYMDMGARTGFVLGATFARTITADEVEAAARAYLEAGPAGARWLLTMEHIRESVRARVQAAFRAAGFEVQS